MRLSCAGELGWELHCATEDEAGLFESLIGAGEGFGLAPVGSRAMGQLRLEKGYRSWGAELTSEVSPRSAGLERFCSSRKQYIGRGAIDAARAVSPEYRLATLVVDSLEADCWGSEPIYRDGRPAGHVTSSGYGWRTGASLAVGWIPFDATAPGTLLGIEILGVRREARVVADPLYDPQNYRLLS